MAPRKSTASAVADGADDAGQTPLAPGGKRNPPGSVLPQLQGKEGMLSVDDLGLPRTMVQRLAKGVLPANTQIQKDAQLAIWKSATVFVNYLTSHANENAMRVSKKTIQPKDVLDAIHDLEFDAFLPRLDAELQKYNAVQCDKRNSYRRKVREEAKTKSATAPAAAATPGSSLAAPSDDGDPLAPRDGTGALVGVVLPSPRGAAKGDSEPATKKMRRSKDAAAVAEDEEEDEDDENEGEGDAGDGEVEEDDEEEDEEEEEDDEEEEPEDEGGEEDSEDAGSEGGGPSDGHDRLGYQKRDDTDDETMAADDSD